MIVSLLLVGFQGAALPLVLARKDDPTTPGEIARIFRILSALALSMFALLSIMASPMLRLLVAPTYQPTESVVPFLVLSVTLSGISMFPPGLSIRKRTGIAATLSVIGGLVNLAGALLLVPPLGIVGAGIATAVSSLLWFVMLMIASQRFYRVPHDWRRLTMTSFLVVLLVIVAFAILPASRAQSLTGVTLAIRALFVLAGMALASRALADHELTATWRSIVRRIRSIGLIGTPAEK